MPAQRLLAWPALCPCGRLGASGKSLLLKDCCGRFIDDFASTPAPDAELLMRSRYTAFALSDAGYLLATWHADHRPTHIEFDPRVKWLGLEVCEYRLVDATHAEVKFIARQKSPASAAHRLHERSRFVQEAGRWSYLNGDQAGV